MRCARVPNSELVHEVAVSQPLWAITDFPLLIDESDTTKSAAVLPLRVIVAVAAGFAASSATDSTGMSTVKLGGMLIG